MTTPERVCGFCGSRGPFSDEHVWPQWIRRLLPREHWGWAFEEHFGGAAYDDPERTSPLTKRRTGQQHAFAVKARDVCTECNTGWMSDLEEAVAPIITDLICGEPTVIPVADRQVVATWAAKTLMAIELASPSPNPIPPSHYESIFVRARSAGLAPEPPVWTQVWIGTRAEYAPLLRAYGAVDLEAGARHYFAALGVGGAAFVIFGTDTDNDVALSFPDDLDRFVHPVWPVGPQSKNITLRFENMLPDAGYLMLADLFATIDAFPQRPLGGQPVTPEAIEARISTIAEEMERGTRPVRHCAFCGHAGRPSFARPWPEWVDLYAQDWLRPELVEAQKQHPICDVCRSGWMTRLDELAEPIMSRMLAGDVGTIGEREQAVVAAWATKTLAAAYAPTPLPRPITPLHFRTIYEHFKDGDLELPSLTHVWLVRRDGTTDRPLMPVQRLTSNSGTSPAYNAVLALGPIAFLEFVFLGDNAEIPEFRRAARIAPFDRAQPLPPATVVTEEQLLRWARFMSDY